MLPYISWRHSSHAIIYTVIFFEKKSIGAKNSCNVTLVTYTSNFLFHPGAEVISDSCRLNINVIYYLQNATISIAKVEEAYKCESQSKGVIEEAIQFLSFDELLDGTDATEDVDENRLLPAMNKLWPYLVICLRNKISVVGFFTSGCFPLCKFCWLFITLLHCLIHQC